METSAFLPFMTLYQSQRNVNAIRQKHLKQYKSGVIIKQRIFICQNNYCFSIYIL